MTTQKPYHWLKHLTQTIHFESVATTVFERLIHGNGPGLLVLYGPPKVANKSFFLNTVEAFQKGASAAEEFVSPELWRLLGELEPGQYQCVNIKKDCPIQPYGNIYRAPLELAVPMALATAAHTKGLRKGRDIVILCDDLHEFIVHNKQTNEQFLKSLSSALDNLKGISFLGASQGGHGYSPWDAKAVLGLEHVLDLGWD